MNENNKYTITSNAHLKFFKFRLLDFTGKQLRFEKKLFPKFKAIDIKGFKIYNNSEHYIEYSVDSYKKL